MWITPAAARRQAPVAAAAAQTPLTTMKLGAALVQRLLPSASGAARRVQRRWTSCRVRTQQSPVCCVLAGLALLPV